MILQRRAPHIGKIRDEKGMQWKGRARKRREGKRRGATGREWNGNLRK